jgi:hypothetical protein
MVSRRGIAALPLLLLLACAHDKESAPPPPPVPAANAADVASPEAIVAAAYDVISGPKGNARDWNRLRSLFVPGARLIPTVPNEKGGGYTTHMYTVEEFIPVAQDAFDKDGFYEKGIASRMERYGTIAQVFSTYESRHSAGEAPFQRGINSFQLFFDGTRYWLVTIFWMAETADTPIPAEFLKSVP